MSDQSIAQAIDSMMDARYEQPGSFDLFTNNLLNLGITRFHFDAMTDQTHFYNEQQLVHSILRKDLRKARSKEHWQASAHLHASKVREALCQFDNDEISPVQFHKELLAAGVVFCNVFLHARKIYYCGNDGDYFLENY